MGAGHATDDGATPHATVAVSPAAVAAVAAHGARRTAAAALAARSSSSSLVQWRVASMVPKLMARCVGREAEARHLANRVEALLTTGEASLCVVSGEPGIGKSHLLRELRRCYGESEVRVVHAEAQRHDAEPLSVWLTLIRSLLAAHLRAPAEQARLDPHLAAELLPAEFRGWAGHVAALIEGRAGAAATLPRQLHFECEMLGKLVCGLVRAAPQLILIDAAENLSTWAWQIAARVLADAPSVCLLIASRELQTWGEAAAAAEFERLLAVAAAAHAGATCRMTPAVRLSRVELLPLEARTTRVLLASSLGLQEPEALLEETVARAHARCGGNPGYLLEFAQQLPSREAFAQRAGAATARREGLLRSASYPPFASVEGNGYGSEGKTDEEGEEGERARRVPALSTPSMPP